MCQYGNRLRPQGAKLLSGTAPPGPYRRPGSQSLQAVTVKWAGAGEIVVRIAAHEQMPHFGVAALRKDHTIPGVWFGEVMGRSYFED